MDICDTLRHYVDQFMWTREFKISQEVGRNGCSVDGTGTSQPWVPASRLAEPLWTAPGLKSGIGVRELMSTSEEKKKSAGGE